MTIKFKNMIEQSQHENEADKVKHSKAFVLFGRRVEFNFGCCQFR